MSDDFTRHDLLPPMRIRIVESDGEVIELLATTSKGDVIVICEMLISGRSLELSKLHIDGPGAGSIGFRELRNIAKLFGIQQGVGRVIIQGARRTTGAYPGHLPRAITINCEESDDKGHNPRLA